ncbi:hypothetical protein ED28_00765 [[Pantoea] beijingensis]|uniref:C-type lysozyme inhibitor domain-containing protein n=1 Tax=[Pantoea] beijingensis TaxID=1324864 RepID=A0A443IHJ9_9GAMM|nr:MULTISPECIES: MliC family protein [Erwiniaceae]RWR03547.1 hypothetical protein ED28_00765 [[Pantoea] beijingensis]
MKKQLAIGAVVLTLSGCGLMSSQSHEEVQTLHYLCGTMPLTVTQDNSRQQVSFIMDGTPLKLKQVVAASGSRYTDGNYVFWSKGDAAFIQRNDKIIVNDCQRQSAG